MIPKDYKAADPSHGIARNGNGPIGEARHVVDLADAERIFTNALAQQFKQQEVRLAACIERMLATRTAGHAEEAPWKRSCTMPNDWSAVVCTSAMSPPGCCVDPHEEPDEWTTNSAGLSPKKPRCSVGWTDGTPQSAISRNEVSSATVAPKAISTRGSNLTEKSPAFKIMIEDRDEGDVHQKVIELAEWWMDLEEPPRTGLLASVVSHRTFEVICIVVILANAWFTVIATDLEIANVNGSPPRLIVAGEIFFVCFYAAELMLKLAVHRLYFFANQDYMWNTFDMLLVVFAIYDQGAALFLTGGTAPNLTFVRTIRIVKVAKILRVVRVMRFFTELRLVLNSLLGSLVSLFWSLTMLAFIYYIFGLIFVQGSISALVASSTDVDDEGRGMLMEHYGSVSMSMFSLFKATTGGDDWAVFFDPVALTGPLNVCLFVFFICFFQVALVNILTGIFVENAMKLAQPNNEALALEQRKKEIIEVDELRRLCSEMDTDHSGKISANEFNRMVAFGKMKAYLTVLGLDIKDAEMFFKMIATTSENEEVDIESFVSGCMRLRGHASSADLQNAVLQQKILLRNQRLFQDACTNEFRSLNEAMAHLHSRIGRTSRTDVTV